MWCKRWACYVLINRATFKNEYNKYYAVFTIQEETVQEKEQTRYIAFDPNHSNLAWGCDNLGNSIEIQYPKFVKDIDKRIDNVKSKRDKCKSRIHKTIILDSNKNPSGKFYFRASRKYRHMNNLVKKLYYKRREQIKQFLYTIANKLFANYDVVACGDYTPRGGGINKVVKRN